MSAAVRWGILSTANIAEKFCVAASRASNAQVVAVASREQSKAEAFVSANCPGASAYGSYDKLLNDSNVQVVYVPLPSGVCTEWLLKVAAAKKHVLCEKPIAPDDASTEQIIKAFQEAGLQFMDNTMMMHGERWASMSKVLQDKEFFGTVRHVTSTFTLPLALENDWSASNVRMKGSLEPLGSLGDLGWYSARLSLFAFGYEMPEAVSCRFLEETPEGVPVTAVATLKYSDGRMANFDCSFKVAWRQWAEISSEKCALRLEDFVIPSNADVCSYTISRGSVSDKALTFPNELVRTEEFRGTAQHTALVEKMSEIVASGQLEDFWPKVALQTQRLMSTLVASARDNGKWVVP